MNDYYINLKGYVEDRIKANLPKAQDALDNTIVNDFVPFMPMQTGSFIQQVRMRNASLAGTGMVCAATGVSGRFLYYGKKMVDSETGKGARMIPLDGGEVIFRYRAGAKLVPTDQNITYSNPNAVQKWYEHAKGLYMTDWKNLVKRILINGK